MHERSPKNTPLDTILYEIDMFRHCARTLPQKKTLVEQTKSELDRYEYYLGIEGFLLHLRNVIAFLINRGHQKTDLIINVPEQWFGRKADQREYSDLVKVAKGINRAHRGEGSTCYDEISKFLQHCTTYRHERARHWDIEGIFEKLDPVLQSFEKRFAPTPTKTDDVALKIDMRTKESTTATFRTISVPGPFPGSRNDRKK